MNILKTGVIGTFGTLALGHTIEKSMGTCDTDVQKPIDTVSIIMASYDEEALIEISTSSIKSQSIIAAYPQYFEFILVDSMSRDRTVELARPFVDKVIIAPRGKLTARNIATDQSRGNIIVSTDSDTYYPYNWLNTLLKPLNDLNHPHIAGVNGSTFDYGIPKIPGIVHTIGSFLDRTVVHRNQMVGRNSAYYKHDFYFSGRFREDINQFNLRDILKEEEKDFGNRLAKLGKIIFKVNAYCVHLGGRKIGCRWGLENRQICETYRFGKDRF